MTNLTQKFGFMIGKNVPNYTVSIRIFPRILESILTPIMQQIIINTRIQYKLKHKHEKLN